MRIRIGDSFAFEFLYPRLLRGRKERQSIVEWGHPRSMANLDHTIYTDRRTIDQAAQRQIPNRRQFGGKRIEVLFNLQLNWVQEKSLLASRQRKEPPFQPQRF